ncbi:mCG142122 [Mus musculus]|nr:mCG142122 [Mus musculus]
MKTFSETKNISNLKPDLSDFRRWEFRHLIKTPWVRSHSWREE